MAYTPQQEAEFKEAFARRRRLQLIVTIPFVVLLLGAVILAERNGEAPFGLPQSLVIPGFIAIVGGLLAFSLRNWRCPACNRYLGKETNPKYCSKCGAALR